MVQVNVLLVSNLWGGKPMQIKVFIKKMDFIAKIKRATLKSINMETIVYSDSFRKAKQIAC